MYYFLLHSAVLQNRELTKQSCFTVSQIGTVLIVRCCILQQLHVAINNLTIELLLSSEPTLDLIWRKKENANRC